MVLLAGVFLFCGATVAVVQHQYQVNKRLYREAASSFTTQTGTAPSGPSLFKKTDPGELAPDAEPGELEITLRRDVKQVTEFYSGKVIPVIDRKFKDMFAAPETKLYLVE